MQELNSFYWTLQKYISDHTFAGIPLDIIAHITVAAFITVVLLKMHLRLVYVVLIVFSIAIIKEIIDWQFQVKVSADESFKDIVVTMLYPMLISYLRTRRKKN